MNLPLVAAARCRIIRAVGSLRHAVPVALLLVAAQLFAAEPSYHVLVLYSDNRTLPAVAVIDEEFDATLRARFGSHADISNEFLDLDRVDRPAYHEQLVRFLREKYGGTRIDAVVAIRGPALEFLLDHRDELFPGVPIVHASVAAPELAARKLPPDVIGAPIRFEPGKTLEVALRLHPGTRRVVVVTGTSEYDRAWERLLRSTFAPFAERVALDYWAGLSLAEIMARLPRLEPGALVFLPGMLQDATGQRFVPRQVGAEMVAATSVPVYSSISTAMGTGAVGGYLVPLEDVGRIAAEAVTRLLKGEAPASVATPPAVPNVYMFDARQLRRFRVAESSLPEGAVLMFREPTLWEAYRWQIIAVIALLALQAAMIAGLLVQRRIRLRTESRLRESERRMNLAAAATGLGMWEQDVSGRDSWANPQQRQLLGLGPEEHYDLERFLLAVHPSDRPAVGAVVEEAMAKGGEYDIQYRVQPAAGPVTWLVSRGTVELDSHGRPARLRGVTADITQRVEADLQAQRHRSELAHLSRVGMLGQLSGSLAHELNQPLTAILSNAQAALRFLNANPADVSEVRDILTDIVADDRRAGDVIRRLRALFERGEAKHEPLDLNEVIRGILGLVRSDLVSRNVAVAVELDADLPVVDGDRVQLQQVLLNLVLNACEAMADTAVPERRLTIRTKVTDGPQVAVSVADGGKGIALDQVEKIFEPFVTAKAFGIGLGLAIARGIVTAHGGRLWAANNPDRGVTFTFTLPVRAAERPLRPAGEPRAAVSEAAGT